MKGLLHGTLWLRNSGEQIQSGRLKDEITRDTITPWYGKQHKEDKGWLFKEIKIATAWVVNFEGTPFMCIEWMIDGVLEASSLQSTVSQEHRDNHAYMSRCQQFACKWAYFPVSFGSFVEVWTILMFKSTLFHLALKMWLQGTILSASVEAVRWNFEILDFEKNRNAIYLSA